MLGLPQRKTALARGDDDTFGMTQDWNSGTCYKMRGHVPSYSPMSEAISIILNWPFTGATRLVPTRWILACLAALIVAAPACAQMTQMTQARDLAADSPSALVDFAGKATTQAEFARRSQVSMMPTVMLFSPRGLALAEPLVGFGSADYYGYFLDQHIDAALAQLRATH